MGYFCSMEIEQIIKNSRFEKEPAQISLFDAMKYILGGEAIFTVFSVKKEKTYTYKCVQSVSYINNNPIKNNRWMLFLLNNKNNTNDYSYMGVIDNKESDNPRILTLRITEKSKITIEAPSFQIFKHLLFALQCPPEYIITLLNRVKVYHNGTCSICGRHLTSYVSVNVGMGPVCAPDIHYEYINECKIRGLIIPKN